MKKEHAQFMVKLGKRIKALREAKKIDRKQFAFECSLSRAHLIGIEEGRTKAGIVTLLKIADGLEITLSELTNILNTTDWLL